MPSFVPVSVSNRHKVGIFCIKKGHKIYMHDHHNMAVILKVLCGKIQYRSVDIVNPKFRNLNWAQFLYCYKYQIDVPARVDISDEISAGFQSCVLPSSGNIHELEAIEDCAFLDVIMPNYNYTDRK